MNLDEIIRGRFVAVDVEGDGNNPARPVEISLITVEKGSVVDSAHWLVNPGAPISAFVSGLHGLTDDDVRDAPFLPEIAPEIRRRLEGEVVAAHNPKGDLDMLRTGVPDVDFLPAQVIDTVRLAKCLLPGLDRYRLENVVAKLGLEHEGRGGRSGRHTSDHDAAMVARIVLSLVPMIPKAKQMAHVTRMATVTLSPNQQRRLRETLEAAQADAPKGNGPA